MIASVRIALIVLTATFGLSAQTLTITSISLGLVPSPAAEPGDTVSLNYSIGFTGVPPIGPIPVEILMLPAGSSAGGSGLVVGTAVANLGANSASFTIPATGLNPANGDYSAGIRLVQTGLKKYTTATFPVLTLPDLRAVSITYGNATIGVLRSISFATSNIGLALPAGSSYTVKLYLSQDTVLGANDILLDIFTLGPNQFGVFPFQYLIDPSLPAVPGINHLIIDIAPPAQGEFNLVNNRLASAPFNLSPPPYVGTREDVEMGARINDFPGLGLGPYVLPCVGGDVFRVYIDSPGGSQYGKFLAFLGNAFPTGGMPPRPFGFPYCHFDPADPNFIVILDPVQPNPFFGPTQLFPGGNYLQFQIPYGLAGVSATFQAITLDPAAANGWFMASTAYELQLN